MVEIISDELLIAKDSSFQMKTKYDDLDSNNLSDNIHHLFEDFKMRYPDIMNDILSEEICLERIGNNINNLAANDNSLSPEQTNKNKLKIKDINKELLQKEEIVDKMTLQLYDTLDKIINFCIKHEKVLYS